MTSLDASLLGGSKGAGTDPLGQHGMSLDRPSAGRLAFTDWRLHLPARLRMRRAIRVRQSSRRSPPRTSLQSKSGVVTGGSRDVSLAARG